jgi:hypothetical protein
MTPAQIQKKLREKRKELGQCLSCSSPSRPNKNTCHSCQLKKSTSIKKYRNKNKILFNEMVRTRYAKKKSSSECTRCSNQAVKGHTLCTSCSDFSKIRHKTLYEKKIRNDKCVNCSAKIKDSVLCEKCKEKRSGYINQPEVLQRNKLLRVDNWRSILLSNMKARAIKKKIDIDPDLSIDDISDPKGQKCPVFGFEFSIGENGKKDWSAR